MLDHTGVRHDIVTTFLFVIVAACIVLYIGRKSERLSGRKYPSVPDKFYEGTDMFKYHVFLGLFLVSSYIFPLFLVSKDITPEIIWAELPIRLVACGAGVALLFAPLWDNATYRTRRWWMAMLIIFPTTSVLSYILEGNNCANLIHMTICFGILSCFLHWKRLLLFGGISIFIACIVAFYVGVDVRSFPMIWYYYPSYAIIFSCMIGGIFTAYRDTERDKKLKLLGDCVYSLVEECKRAVMLSRSLYDVNLMYIRDISEVRAVNKGKKWKDCIALEEAGEAALLKAKKAATYSINVMDALLVARCGDIFDAGVWKKDKISVYNLVKHIMDNLILPDEIQNRISVRINPKYDAIIESNEYLITAVLMNMLTNAFYHGLGEVRKAKLVVRLKPDGVVEIEDTADGMPPIVLNKVFDRFYTTIDDTVGMGTAMSHCKHIMQDLGGDIVYKGIDRVGSIGFLLVKKP